MLYRQSFVMIYEFSFWRKGIDWSLLVSFHLTTFFSLSCRIKLFNLSLFTTFVDRELCSCRLNGTSHWNMGPWYCMCIIVLNYKLYSDDEDVFINPLCCSYDQMDEVQPSVILGGIIEKKKKKGKKVHLRNFISILILFWPAF